MMRDTMRLVLAGLILWASPLSGQDASQHDDGTKIVSMGQPSWLSPYGSLSGGGYFEDGASDFTSYLSLGIRRDLVSPVTAAAAVDVEGYAGLRGGAADGGVRALFSIPFLRMGFGVDWNFKDGSLPFVLRLSAPFKRGGVIGRGGRLAVDWLPARGSSFNVALSVPIGDKWAGKTRPNHIRYPVGPDQPDLEPVAYVDPALEPVLANVRETAYWVNRLTVPYFDQTARRRDQAVAEFTDYVRGIQMRLASPDPLFGGTHTAAGENLAYHAEVARAFSIALSGEDLPLGRSIAPGEEVAVMARAILLEQVLLPYDRLLGVHKKKDTTKDLAFTAMQEFTEWASRSDLVSADRLDAVRYVFQAVLNAVEAARAESRKWWGDDRLVWIPLQYGLLPEDHDTQAELDEIIERATGKVFTNGNSASYAQGAQFQWELTVGVQRAEDYHVLWIHDYKGINKQGEPDLISFYVTRNYLRTLAHRVRAYDEAGRLPAYFILIDQHYYEIAKARRWLNVLESPLGDLPDLPESFEWMADSLAIAQAELRAAVDGSTRLQADADRYGEDWLENRVKVQVSVTNPADISFWGNSYVPLASWPDNAIRDHRKIAFYDITEADPYRGSAVFSGMGVGEHYVGPNWEDRALILSGPAALEAKDQARALLESQGFDEAEIPEPLRARPFAADYWERVEERAAPHEGDARAIQLHNGTGYLMKPINVLKAILYTLMPPASVIIDPDSLFHSPLWASMLFGSSLRGVRVIIIHPSQKNAPGQSFMTLSRASEMFERMIIAEQGLSDQLAEVGGLYKGGLYDIDVDVGNLPARAKLVADGLRSTPWIQELLPASPELLSVYDDQGEIFAAATGGRQVDYLSDELGGVRRPMLHLKTNFFVTGPTLEALLRLPAFAAFARDFAVQRSLDVVARSEYREARELNTALRDEFYDLIAELREQHPELADRGVGYFVVGSSNQDYRSMMMDGEAAVAVAGRAIVVGLFDSIGLAAAATYPRSLEELNEYLPYYADMKWKLSRWIKVAL